MAYQPTRLGMLVRFEPHRATREILTAFRRCGGVAYRAAADLGVDRRTLDRWIARLDGEHAVRESIEEIRSAARSAA